MVFINEIKKVLQIACRVVIVTHKIPGGDQLGASLALQGMLNKLNHKVKVIVPFEFASDFNFIRGINSVIVGENQAEEAMFEFEKADIIFALGFDSLVQIDRFGLDLMASKALKIHLDRSSDPEPFADFLFSKPEASTTTEVLYDFLHETELDQNIDVLIAESLYTGLISATGSFFHNTTTRTFEIASSLKKLGIDDQMIQIRLFEHITEMNRELWLAARK